MVYWASAYPIPPAATPERIWALLRRQVVYLESSCPPYPIFSLIRELALCLAVCALGESNSRRPILKARGRFLPITILRIALLRIIGAQSLRSFSATQDASEEALSFSVGAYRYPPTSSGSEPATGGGSGLRPCTPCELCLVCESILPGQGLSHRQRATSWSGWRESNPRVQLGRLAFYR